MGFNKKFIRPLEAVKEEYEMKTLDEFVQSYIKADAMIGPSDSIDFINDAIEKWVNQNKRENT